MSGPAASPLLHKMAIAGGSINWRKLCFIRLKPGFRNTLYQYRQKKKGGFQKYSQLTPKDPDLVFDTEVVVRIKR